MPDFFIYEGTPSVSLHYFLSYMVCLARHEVVARHDFIYRFLDADGIKAFGYPDYDYSAMGGEGINLRL